MSSNKEQRLLSTKEVAYSLAISVYQLYRMRARGEGPRAIKIGKLYKYRHEAVDKWLEEQEK